MALPIGRHKTLEPKSHVRQRFPDQAERCAQHQAQEMVQRGVVGFVHRLRAADPGDVDQEVDVPPPPHREFHHSCRRVIVGEIDGERAHPV